jgi:hypothetical protein
MNDADRSNAKSFIAQIGTLPVPQLIPNGVVTITTHSEIQGCLTFGSRPLALLVMNPSFAKTFAMTLLERVRDYEKIIGHEVSSLEELRSKSPEI